MLKVDTAPLRSKRWLALLLVVLGIVGFLVRGYHDEREALHFRDFKQPYSSARCLLSHCDPYSEPDTRAVFLAAGGIDNDKIVFDPYSALYPPFSLVMLTPIAALPYPVAHDVWEVLIAATFAIAIMLALQLSLAAAEVSVQLAAVLAIFAFSSTILLMLGQISGLVIALMGIGFFLMMRERWLVIAGACFFIALMLKPHDAGLPFLYMLFAGPRWRKTFYWVSAACIAFTVGSVFWFAHMPATAHWLVELGVNLKGNSAASSVNNPAAPEAIFLADLQSIFAVVRDQSSFYNSAAAGVSVLLFCLWAVPALRLPNSLTKHVLSIAAISCIMLLPLYHRQYDSRILLLVFPAVACLMDRRQGRIWGMTGLTLTGIATVVSSHSFLNIVVTRYPAAIRAASPVRTLLLYRPIASIFLVLAVYFILSMYREMRKQERAFATALL
jgi:hypothetical protein